MAARRRTRRKPVQRRALGVTKRLQALDRLLRDKRPRHPLELLAVQRQIHDLEHAHRRGLKWDEDKAARAVAFFKLLRHWKGKWAGKPLELEPWQEHCVIAPLFGWVRAKNGTRRFRQVYKEVPRKNGKTTECAGIGLQGLFADNEPGAEVYAAATVRDQACILFRDAQRCMGPELRKLGKSFKFSITFDALGGSFRPLSSDHDSLDGLNTSRCIIDELHAHRSRGLWDVMQGSTGSREQPLIVAITTAGNDRNSICWEVREMARQVLEGKPDHRDDFFAFIAAAEETDDWENPATWHKANPNLGVSVSWDDMKEKAQNAKASPTAEADFKRKRLNLWVFGQQSWIPAITWDQCRVSQAVAAEQRRGELFAGADLGWRDDFAAYARVWPERISRQDVAEDEDEDAAPLEEAPTVRRPLAICRSKIIRCHVDVKFWVPSEGRRRIDEAPLANWIKKKLVNVVPGNAIHPEVILAQILEDRQRWDFKEICIDPNNARQFGLDLVSHDVPTFEFFQSHTNYNEPSREFERLAAAGLVSHDGNDVLRWMIGNTAVKVDHREYMMPDKKKSSEKIDGVVAILMAFARAMFTEIDPGSVYDREGLFVMGGP